MNCPQCKDEMIKTSISRHHDEYHYCRACKKELKEMMPQSGFFEQAIAEQMVDALEAVKTPNPLLPKGQFPWGPTTPYPPGAPTPPTAGIANVPPAQIGQQPIPSGLTAVKAIPIRMALNKKPAAPCGYDPFTHEEVHYIQRALSGINLYCNCGLYDLHGVKNQLMP